MPKISELIDNLQKNYKPDDTIAYSLWSKDDVNSCIEEKNEWEVDEDEKIRPLSDEEIEWVLEAFHGNQDSEYGLTWVGLGCYVDEIIMERAEGESNSTLENK